MPVNDSISTYYTVLQEARAIVRDIDEGAAIYRSSRTDSQSLDVTDKIYAHQTAVVEMLEELKHAKERRKSPRS